MTPDPRVREACERTLSMLRELERTATPDEKRAIARDFRIGEGWPADQAAEARRIMGRLGAHGVAAPTWGHGPSLLAHVHRMK